MRVFVHYKKCYIPWLYDAKFDVERKWSISFGKIHVHTMIALVVTAVVSSRKEEQARRY